MWKASGFFSLSCGGAIVWSQDTTVSVCGPSIMGWHHFTHLNITPLCLRGAGEYTRLGDENHRRCSNDTTPAGLTPAAAGPQSPGPALLRRINIKLNTRPCSVNFNAVSNDWGLCFTTPQGSKYPGGRAAESQCKLFSCPF